MTEAALSKYWEPPFVVDVLRTLSVHGRGSSDPTFRVDATGAVWRTSLTPDGPATLRVVARKGSVTADAWGPGASWILAALPAQLGRYDSIDGFDPSTHDVLHQAARRYPGLRLSRSDRVMEALVPAILEQKVVSLEAHRAWKILLAKHGTPPPGPAPRGMRVFPDPRTWRKIPSWDWHRAGVEGVRARTIIAATHAAAAFEREKDSSKLDRILRSIPGIGVWTSAETRQRSHGDPDAVSVGDYNLPKAVGWALARRVTDDAGMLELLAPYAGHRHRVTRLVELSGLRPPRRGPRMPVRDYRGF